MLAITTRHCKETVKKPTRPGAKLFHGQSILRKVLHIQPLLTQSHCCCHRVLKVNIIAGWVQPASIFLSSGAESTKSSSTESKVFTGKSVFSGEIAAKKPRSYLQTHMAERLCELHTQKFVDEFLSNVSIEINRINEDFGNALLQ